MITSDKDHLAIFGELSGVTKMAPQMLKTLLEYISQSSSEGLADDLTLMFKQDEQCTTWFDEYIKLKSLNKPHAKAMELTVKVFEETTDLMVQKYIVNRTLNCHGLEPSHLTAIKTLLNSIGDEPADVKEVLSRENLQGNQTIQMISVTEE